MEFEDSSEMKLGRNEIWSENQELPRRVLARMVSTMDGELSVCTCVCVGVCGCVCGGGPPFLCWEYLKCFISIKSKLCC